MSVENDPRYIAMKRELEELQARNAKSAREMFEREVVEALKAAGAPAKRAERFAASLIGRQVDAENRRFVEWPWLDLEEGARRFVQADDTGVFKPDPGSTSTTASSEPPSFSGGDTAGWFEVARASIRVEDVAPDPAQRKPVDWEELAQLASGRIASGKVSFR